MLFDVFYIRYLFEFMYMYFLLKIKQCMDMVKKITIYFFLNVVKLKEYKYFRSGPS